MSDSEDAGAAASDSEGPEEGAQPASDDSGDDVFEFKAPKRRGRPPKQRASAEASSTPAGSGSKPGRPAGYRAATAGLDPGSGESGGQRQRRQTEGFSPAKAAEAIREAAREERHRRSEAEQGGGRQARRRGDR
eukprot:105720-Prymnesium_polylepis.1